MLRLLQTVVACFSNSLMKYSKSIIFGPTALLTLTLLACSDNSIHQTTKEHVETVSTLELSSETWQSELYQSNWSPTPDKSFEEDKIIQDFSYAGYMKSERPLPALNNTFTYNVVLDFGADPTGQKDSTQAIQNAINKIATKGGGVVYLPEGTYLLSPPKDKSEALIIQGSNIVLKGDGPSKTRLLNTSTEMRGKRIILVTSPEGPNWRTLQKPVTYITQDLMTPTREVPVESIAGFSVGDYIIIRSDPNDSWIAEHNETEDWQGYESKIGSILYLRQIESIDVRKNILTIDIPTRYYLKRLDRPQVYLKTGLVSQVGLQGFSIGNLQHPGESGWKNLDFSAPKGEYTTRLIATAGLDPQYAKKIKSAYHVHFSFAIAMQGVVNAWISNVDSFQAEGNDTGAHLLSNGIRLKECANVTVVNCKFQKAQYGGGGGNGYMFRIDNANDCLFENCTAAYSRHGFSISGMAASGNVFYKCLDRETGHQTGSKSTDDNTTGGKSSDSHMWFSHSNLYDNCVADNSWFEARDRFYPKMSKPRHNTTSAHTVFWNTEGLSNSHRPFVVWSNQARFGYVIGTRGPVSAVNTESAYPERDGRMSPVDHVEGVGKGSSLYPISLFEDQRKRRFGIPLTSNTNSQQ